MIFSCLGTAKVPTHPEDHISVLRSKVAEGLNMPSGKYGVYCASCKAFIEINSYKDYRPQFSPTEGRIESVRCGACGDVVTYVESDVVYLDDEAKTAGA
jgi:hypothetical protein